MEKKAKVATHAFEILKIEANKLTLKPGSGFQPALAPAVGDVGYFSGDTNFDDRSYPTIDEVDFSECREPDYIFAVVLSAHFDHLLDDMDRPSDARFNVGKIVNWENA